MPVTVNLADFAVRNCFALNRTSPVVTTAAVFSSSCVCCNVLLHFSGVGHKIDLEFDIDTLRIRNLEEEEVKSQFAYKTSAVYDTLKQKSKISPSDVTPKLDPTKGETMGVKQKAEVEGTKLRKLLNELHSDEEQ